MGNIKLDFSPPDRRFWANECLSHTLDLPIVGGELTAYYHRLAWWDSGYWKIGFKIPGPDLRYAPAHVQLSEAQTQSFIAHLETIRAKADTWKEQNFVGYHRRRIAQVAGVEISAQWGQGKLWCVLSAISHTRKNLSVEWQELYMVKALYKLYSAQTKGNEMVKALRFNQ